MRKYRNYRSIKEEERLYEAKEPFRVICKCGHSVVILNKRKYKLCTYCRHYVFLDKETEFKFRMKENLLKEKRRKNER